MGDFFLLLLVSLHLKSNFTKKRRKLLLSSSEEESGFMLWACEFQDRRFHISVTGVEVQGA
jgi:hypothetical protein